MAHRARALSARATRLRASRCAAEKALVTGASSGIGRAVAIALAEAAPMWRELGLGRGQGQGRVREIEALGVRAFPVGAGVGDEAQVLAMFERTLDPQCGPHDALSGFRSRWLRLST
jgi:glucose 1-dehydrogenase